MWFLLFFNFCNDLWGSCSALTNIENSTDSSKPLSNDDLDTFSLVGSKESNELSNEHEISKCQKENEVDADNSDVPNVQMFPLPLPSKTCALPFDSALERGLKNIFYHQRDVKNYTD